MASKDYYRILNIPSSASTEEIKKAFRRLAQQYHPDKNSGDRFATEKFSEIHEAYRILSDNRKRAEYNYIRYTENPKRPASQPAHSPEDLLQLTGKLVKEIALADPYRIDRDLLSFQVMDILSNEHLNLLRAGNNEPVNRKIVDQLILVLHLLPFHMLGEIVQRLEKLAGNDLPAQRSLQHFIKQARQQYYWNRYKVYIALAVAALACVLILLSGN